MAEGMRPARRRPLRILRAVRSTLPLLVLLATGCDGADCTAEPFAPTCPIVIAGTAPPRAMVFQSTRNPAYEIYTANADGTDVVRLTTTGRNGQPRWSPDGTQIVFTSWRSGAAEVWIMNADGSAQRRLIAHDRPAYMPDWSPDGTRIAFSAERGDGNFDVYVVGSDGTNLRRLTSSASHWGPRWSPDSRRLAVRWMESSAQCPCIATLPQCPCNGRISVMNADGSDPRVLPQVGECDASPDWSPDGTHIAFASYRSTGPGVPARGQLMVMRADGAHVRPLTVGIGDEFSPSWSPSTGLIFYVRTWQIYSIRPGDGAAAVRISAVDENDLAVHVR